eukprot:GILK01009699.1.p1 GENE.GILK01009699.1~~GILK01009699.1.p1  ORF type:complete len:368 (-),score=36.96 GILK01009699.1:22-1125(-)
MSLLVPSNVAGTAFHGFLAVQHLEFRVALTPPAGYREGQRMQGYSFLCETALQNILKGYESLVQQRLAQSVNVEGFMLELQDIIGRIMSNSDQKAIPPAPFYRRILTELDEIGWNMLESIDDSLTQIQVKLEDSAGREHILKMLFPSDYPNSPPTCICDVPIAPEEVQWNGSCSLNHIIRHYQRVYERYQDLWLVLDDIDRHTWVLEPEKPSRKDTMRRVALGDHCSVTVDINPAAPRSICQCTFMGPDKRTAPLRDKLNANLNLWNVSDLVRENLERVLEISFPSPQTSEKEMYTTQCGICYSYRLDDAIPDRVCENFRCGQPFHHVCLSEWLRSDPSTRHSLNIMYGSCPYCSDPITVKTVSASS